MCSSVAKGPRRQNRPRPLQQQTNCSKRYSRLCLRCIEIVRTRVARLRRQFLRARSLALPSGHVRRRCSSPTNILPASHNPVRFQHSAGTPSLSRSAPAHLPTETHYSYSHRLLRKSKTLRPRPRPAPVLLPPREHQRPCPRGLPW